MGLDIRIPLGLVFLLIGGIMGIFGAFTCGNTALYQKSLGMDINLVWGSIMFAVGAILFFFGKRHKPADASASPQPADAAPAAKPRH